MKSTYFSNKKSLQVISPTIKNDIKNSINEIGSFNLTSKYYTFLNKKNVNNLKENNFLVSLSSFGKKFILFITNYKNNKYCIFINKKNDTMTVTQLKFSDDIFLGTLFDGELVKNSEDKWIYLINDIAYYKGENIITKKFSERQSIIENILLNDHDNETLNETFFISKKYYFEYKNIKDLVENYMQHLNYKCAGLYFKNTNNFSDNYLFIFPECRSDTKILDEKIFDTIDNNDNNITNVPNNHEKPLYMKSEKTPFNPSNNHIKSEKTQYNHIKLEKTTCRFLIHSTPMPDIYELYCKNLNNKIEKHGYASVPDFDTSNLLKNIIGDRYDLNEDIHTKFEKNNAIFVECNYHKGFKKWIPFKKIDTMDNITTINQIQIILDSL